MPEIKQRVGELLDGLYSDRVIAVISHMAQNYLDSVEVPSSLHDVTLARMMSKQPTKAVAGLADDINGLLEDLDIVKDGVIYGPLNHILARLFTMPRMLPSYVENYPEPEEKSIYTDPPLLQKPEDKIKKSIDTWFAQASEALSSKHELIRRFKLLGEVGEEIAQVESVYAANGSTQAYELFGIFHLFPSNKQVDLTSTSPGVILPTEADPLRFKDSVVILKKNLLRPTYFEMLKNSVKIGDGRIRRYSANREGTAKNLKEYPQLSDAAKQIISDYLKIKDKFEIRLGEQHPKMKLATLIGNIGVVYSVRDPEQKSKIAHNVTVINPAEAAGWRENIFEEQWEKGEPITSTDIIDELLAA